MKLKLVALSIFLILWMATSFAQETSDHDSTTESAKSFLRNDVEHLVKDEKSLPVDISGATPFNAVTKTKNKNEFVVAPIPFLNPSQGWGLALVGQYIFTVEGDNSPPSIVGGGAFYTEKHSYGGALAYSGKLRDDSWRTGLVVGKATIFYDFYGVGYDQSKYDLSIPIRQDVDFAGVRLLKQLGHKIFAGVELIGAKIETAIETDNPLADYVSEIMPKSEFVAPNFKIERDTRDDSFYPTAGSLFDLQAEFHSEDLHDTQTYQTYKFSWNHYIEVAAFDVLAYRLMTRLSYGDVPFYNLSMYGQAGDLRGYETGKYRDKMMWVGQAEWRHRFTDRWGGVIFAGTGQLAPRVSDFDGAHFLSSGGLGIRFQIAKQNPVDFRFDAAYGDEKISYYFSVGQAF